MKTLFFLLVMVQIINPICAQKNDFKKPDYKLIEKEILDEESDKHYQKLFEKYKNADISLSEEDFRFLYYGFIYQDDYSAYGFSPYSDSLNTLLHKEELTKSDFYEIIRLEKLVLEKAPFNLRDLNILSYAQLQIGDTLSAMQTGYQLEMIMETILSTGDGLKEKTAWHVISVSHEYDIINFLGFQFGGGQSLTRKGCDYLQLADNESGVEGFYFDVNMILNKQRQLFK